MSLQIKIGHFCGLSSSSDFRNWLKNIAPDLLNELASAQKGCRAKQEKMISIHKALYDRGDGDKLEEFIKSRFPYMISGHVKPQTLKPAKTNPPIADPVINQKRASDHIEDLNKHKVFKKYRPDLLTFPHKYIIINSPDRLRELIKNFTADKVGVDYIIIDDHAYIEYFHRRFADIAEQIPQEQREIWIYRQREKQRLAGFKK